nr:glycosyltransferase [uncultured Halomonas sp.]
MKYKLDAFNCEVEVEIFGSHDNQLAIIFPFRYSKGREDGVERIERAINRILEDNNSIEIVIVDSGSPRDVSNQLKNLATKKKTTYIYAETRSEIFSAGKARDIGVIFSSSEYVFFQDIDLLSYEGFYKELLLDCDKLKPDLSKVKVYPCFYLDREESENIAQNHTGIVRNDIYDKYLKLDKCVVNAALWSSAFLVNRRHFLGVGGHDPEFFGHGFEDFEIFNRLAYYDNSFVRPVDYYNDYRKWDSCEFKGFRSYFSLYGRETLKEKKYMVHLYHDPASFDNNYVVKNRENKSLLERKMKEFDRYRQNPIALPNIKAGSTLFLGKAYTAFRNSINYVLPDFGKLYFISEDMFSSSKDFLEFFKRKKFDRVLMPNPYGNDIRLSIYKALRAEGLNVVVSDRGALNNSFFFNSGFNADCSMFDGSNWDRELEDDELLAVESYIYDDLQADDALEQQPKRKTRQEILAKLNIDPTKKVLFVPLQRPNDTVIKHFIGNGRNYQDFCDLVNEFSQNNKEWVVIAKKHPLEKNVLLSPGDNLKVVGDEFHFKDLLSLCDSVFLINSGVGVYALMFEKPLYIYGEAFYSNESLVAGSVGTIEELRKCLSNPQKPNSTSVKKFINHLLNKVYSFGVPHSQVVDNGSETIRVTRGIDFYDVKINGSIAVSRQYSSQPTYSLKSPVYDVYRYWLDNVKGKVADSSVETKGKKAVVIKGEVGDKLNVKDRKKRKLQKNPYKYFYDAKNPMVRAVRFFFPDNFFGKINKKIMLFFIR